MATHLVVLSPFEGHAVGDRIEDAAEVGRLSGNPFVVALATLPEAPPSEEELRERAETLAELERLKAKLGDTVAQRNPADLRGASGHAVSSEALPSGASDTQAANGAVSAKQEG